MIADILDYGDMIYVIYEHGGGAWLQKEAIKELEGGRYDKERYGRKAGRNERENENRSPVRQMD